MFYTYTEAKTAFATGARVTLCEQYKDETGNECIVHGVSDEAAKEISEKINKVIADVLFRTAKRKKT